MLGEEQRIQFELIARDDLYTKDYNTATHITIASGGGGSNQKNRDSHTKNVLFFFFFSPLIFFIRRVHIHHAQGVLFRSLIVRDHADIQRFVCFFVFLNSIFVSFFTIREMEEDESG